VYEGDLEAKARRKAKAKRKVKVGIEEKAGS